ncbi:hypothetical protein [Halapricum salinum]|uniref:Uncharacterized protein n=1 Tax=Halapricum salinum TaxID=1457250 RepID=A0A4D6H8I7_9EURY|nr:hypothetical protein [Halapricum salinum]QCC49791.1 hypothetical protein DV733_00480 [Halapricum salinum]
MSSGDILVTETDGLPTYELDFRYDDPEDPDEVTIFDDADGVTTWISAAVEDTARLDRIA